MARNFTTKCSVYLSQTETEELANNYSGVEHSDSE